MSNVFERLYQSPTKASIAQRTQKYSNPDKDVTEWKRPQARPSSPTTLPVFKSTTPKKPIARPPPPVKDISVPSHSKCMEIFDSIDMNRNGILSLAELDKAVVEIWPELNNKPAIMRAYKASDGDSNGYVSRNEFESFLKFIYYYNNWWRVFESTDQDGDRRITRQEFQMAAPKLGISNAGKVFDEMDTNKGGVVLFDEFCAHMASQGSVPKDTKMNGRAPQKSKSTKKSADEEPAERALPVSSQGKPKNSAETRETVPESIPDAVMNIDVPPKDECFKVFDTVDYNGNGILSLAELDKAVVELWPKFNNKPAIMRAYKASDIDGNGFVKRDEFVFFLKYISYYNNLWKLFGATDTDGDRRLTKDEFLAVAPQLNIKDADGFFEEMDSNKGGVVLFDEFCARMAREDTSNMSITAEKPAAESAPVQVAKDVSGEKPESALATEPIPDAVLNIDVPPKDECFKVFDTVDYNGNGILSLAELDKAVLELWPKLNNKPAIMRAYKASDRDGNGFVKRDEFVFFLKYIVYYNNFWKVFEETDVDDDRRLTKEEFVAASSKLNISDAEEVFEAMDTNDGGYVLFDEFCTHMAARD